MFRVAFRFRAFSDINYVIASYYFITPHFANRVCIPVYSPFSLLHYTLTVAIKIKPIFPLIVIFMRVIMCVISNADEWNFRNNSLYCKCFIANNLKAHPPFSQNWLPQIELKLSLRDTDVKGLEMVSPLTYLPQQNRYKRIECST